MKKENEKCESIADEEKKVNSTNRTKIKATMMVGRNSLKVNCLLCCVLWCLTFNASAGQLDGDPAPGRSPGPPTFSATMGHTIWTNNKNRNSLDADAASNNIVVGVGDHYDDDYRIASSDETHQVPQNTMNRKVTTTASASRPMKQPDKLVDKLTNEFVNHKPCKNLSVNEYLLMKKHSPAIVKVEKASSATENTKTQSSAVGIDVIHSAFDSNYGLVRNVIYTGNATQLLWNLQLLLCHLAPHISLTSIRSDSDATTNSRFRH